MSKLRLMSLFTSLIGILMICIGLVIQNDTDQSMKVTKATSGFDVKNMAASANMIVKETTIKEEKTNDFFLKDVEMETTPSSILVPPRVEVYDGQTFEELSARLNRNLGSDIIAGKGSLIASECLNRGVDPYITVAIILHETGCGSHCSNLARNCYNFGGQKGKPSCNGGAFRQFNSVDEGLVGMIDNLSRNYFSQGLTTPETIGPKYCEGNEWAGKINWFVNKIRNS